MVKEYGGKIKEARLKAGLTQEELAKKLGIAPQNISAWENGKNPSKIETVSKIADALGVPLGYFMKADTPGDYWHNIKVSEPKDGDEWKISCMVNIVEWWTEYFPTRRRSREFAVAAVYDTRQKVFQLYPGNQSVNALLDPDDRSGESGFRVTHWINKPEPAGVLREEAEQHD